MRWTIAGLGLLFLVAACVSRSPLPNVESASSVHFESTVASCTAINIGDGAVLTAGHCTSPFDDATVEGFPATIKWLNREYDVALFHVPGLESAPFSALACRDPRIGEDALMIGDTAWKRNIYMFGKVASNVYVHRPLPALVLFDIRGGPGNSGAPIYGIKGRVIAMAIAVIPLLGNTIAAVPSSTLCELVEGEGTLEDIERN